MARHYTKETVLAAIKNSLGIYTNIAKNLGCTQHTAERWVAKWEETRLAYTEETNTILDLAETKIISAINNGDIATCKWYLTMKGKERGYETIPTIKLDSGEPLNINLSGSGEMTREELLNSGNVEIGGESKGEN